MSTAWLETLLLRGNPFLVPALSSVAAALSCMLLFSLALKLAAIAAAPRAPTAAEKTLAATAFLDNAIGFMYAATLSNGGGRLSRALRLAGVALGFSASLIFSLKSRDAWLALLAAALLAAVWAHATLAHLFGPAFLGSLSAFLGVALAAAAGTQGSGGAARALFYSLVACATVWLILGLLVGNAFIAFQNAIVLGILLTQSFAKGRAAQRQHRE